MTDTRMLLSALAIRTHIGQQRVRTILDTTIHTQLRRLLLLQKKEYTALEASIYALAASKGVDLRGTDPLCLFIACRFLKLRMSLCKSDAPIVSYMIHSCMQGMIDSLTVLHRCSKETTSVHFLAQRLLDCERDCIVQLQGFL